MPALSIRLSLLVLLLACDEPRTEPSTSQQPESEPPTEVTLEVRIDGAAEVGPGHVAWAWLPPEKLAALREGHASDADFVALIERIRVTDPLTPSREPTEIGRAPNDAPGSLFAIFQPHGADPWKAFMGQPTEAQWVGSSEATEVGAARLVVDLVQGRAAAEREEVCTGERRELLEVDAPEVAGAIGNETSRRVCVALPSSYAASGRRRYPVVYLLPGYGGTDTQYLHLAEADHDVILVGIDGRTQYGASYFRNTRFAGAWETFLERVVREVDERFRTRPSPAHRGLLGHSTGGYNSIALSLRRMDLFGGAAASSPDGLDFEAWLLDERRVVRPLWLAWTRTEDALGGPGQMVSYATQFADRSEPNALRWPFSLDTGAVDEAAFREWMQNQPMTLLADPDVAERAKAQLSGHLFLAVGRNDAFDTFRPAERFHARLDELDIEHEWRPTDESHFEGSDRRRTEGLAYLVDAMAEGER